MLSTTARSLLRTQRLKRPGLFIPPHLWSRNHAPRRHLSIQAVYSSFPASLLHYGTRQKSSLFDIKDRELRADDPYDDAVRVSEDGLIYPVTNGAVFMPNTFTMQEIVRQNIDDYFELKEEGKDLECPMILHISKGTPIANGLVLFHHYGAMFSLQPSRGMPLDEFNGVLDEFYSHNARRETVEQWLDDHPFPFAVADDHYAKWMGV